MLEAILKQAGLSEPGFTRKSVKWAITCTSDGRYTGVIPLGEGKGHAFDNCPNLSQPELVGGSVPRCHFLAEALPTVALFWKDDTNEKEQDKFRAKHANFCKLLEQASQEAPYLAPAAAMLSNEVVLEAIRQDLARQKAKSTDTATLRVDEMLPLEQTDWHDWWRQYRHGLKTGKAAGGQMRCLVTGELVEPAATHPKIKGLAGVGGLGTGDVLVGFDKAAFQSFGLEQSANASMSEAIATAYTETLNRLIEDKNVKLGNVLAVYWYTGDVAAENDPLDWLKGLPTEQAAAGAELKARKLLEAIRSGRSDCAGLAESRYCNLLLSGAAGRVMVRDVMEGSYAALVEKVHDWFAHLSIIARDGKSLAPSPKFLAVAGSLVRDLKDLPPPWMQQLWRAAITGNKIPHSALAQATLRARIDVVNDQPAAHARMGLIKAFHVRQGDIAMQATVNTEHPSSAYHCGRLLAVLARLQRAALGDVGAGVVQRYYTAASQTPGLVVGRLVANAKNHLNKLDPKLAHWFENQIAAVMALMTGIPATLTLEQQSLFALGYYQQLAFLNAGKGKADSSDSQIIQETITD